MYQVLYNFFVGNKTYDNAGRGFVTITGASPHTEDQPPFFVCAKTDAVFNATAIDGTTQTGIVLPAGMTLPVMLRRVTTLTSGTIFGIR